MSWPSSGARRSPSPCRHAWGISSDEWEDQHPRATSQPTEVGQSRLAVCLQGGRCPRALVMLPAPRNLRALRLGSGRRDKAPVCRTAARGGGLVKGNSPARIVARMLGPVGCKQEIKRARHEFAHCCVACGGKPLEGCGLLVAEMSGDLLLVTTGGPAAGRQRDASFRVRPSESDRGTKTDCACNAKKRHHSNTRLFDYSSIFVKASS